MIRKLNLRLLLVAQSIVARLGCLITATGCRAVRLHPFRLNSDGKAAGRVNACFNLAVVTTARKVSRRPVAKATRSIGPARPGVGQFAAKRGRVWRSRHGFAEVDGLSGII